MLTHLQIRDFAIVESVELEFGAGLTVLTGETGAGKSIVVDALQCLSGGRAGVDLIRHGAERADLSASFDLREAARELKQLLDEQSIAYETQLDIRRVIGGDGRSRTYLNGQSVPLQVVREAGGYLVDIHGQHEFQSLLRGAAQRDLLDVYGRHESLVSQVGIGHRVWLQLLNRMLELETKARDREGRLELLRHQARELQALELRPGEFESLIDERARLANSGKLGEAAQLALAQLYEGESESAQSSLSRARTALRSVEMLDARLGAVVPMIEDALINVRESSRSLQQYLETLDMDSARRDVVEQRLSTIEDLARKHRVTSVELPAQAERLEAELVAVERADSDLSVVRHDQVAALAAYRALAQQLSARRATAARALSKEVTTHMQTLGMAGGRFTIEITPLQSTEPAPHGIDEVEFKVTANPGQPLKAVSKVASGGELSRLSLAIQVSSALHESRCMVFDEVDSGIGGAVAEIVGRELRSLGEQGQVLCVTHLPQVASQAHHHLRVSKATEGKATRTTLTHLSTDDRVTEIARMLGGIEVSDRAREHAAEMLRASTAPSGEGKPAAAKGKRRR